MYFFSTSICFSLSIRTIDLCSLRVNYSPPPPDFVFFKKDEDDVVDAGVCDAATEVQTIILFRTKLHDGSGHTRPQTKHTHTPVALATLLPYAYAGRNLTTNRHPHHSRAGGHKLNRAVVEEAQEHSFGVSINS